MDKAVHGHGMWRLAICVPWLFLSSIFCQTVPPSNQDASITGGASRAIATPALPSPSEELPKRIFGIIPNYRSHASLKDSKPLTAGEKFKLAARDSFDPGAFLLTGVMLAWPKRRISRVHTAKAWLVTAAIMERHMGT